MGGYRQLGWDSSNVGSQQLGCPTVAVKGHENVIAAVAFSPENRWLLTASWDSTARLWNLELEQLIELACRTAGRDMTQLEWERSIEGKPYSETCSDYRHAEGERTK